jgi:hypothetical protein
VATHRELVLNALRLSDEPLDDDELARRTGISPRQAVNQVCRVLAREGALTRVTGSGGKLVNVLNELAAEHRKYKPVTVERVDSINSGMQPTVNPDALADVDPAKSLIILTCSGAKKPGGFAGPMACSEWPDSLYQARSALHARLPVDSSRVLPAWQRYIGHFYQAATAALAQAVKDQAHILIVSGGYGLVRAEEEIGDYKRRLQLSDWPRGLLESLIVDETHRVNAQAVVAFASTSTDYARLIRHTRWRAAGIHTAVLVTCPPSGGGAMRRVPRTLGEAFAAFWERRPLPAEVVVEPLA